jgi:hypothetical protein
MRNLSMRLEQLEQAAREQGLDDGGDDESLSSLPPHLRQLERELQAAGRPERSLPPHLQAILDQYEGRQSLPHS